MWNNFLFALKCTLEFQPLFMYFLFLHPFFVCRLKILHFVTIYMDGKHQAHLQIDHQHHQSRSILTWWSSSSSSSLSWMIARLLRSKLKNLQPHQKKLLYILLHLWQLYYLAQEHLIISEMDPYPRSKMEKSCRNCFVSSANFSFHKRILHIINFICSWLQWFCLAINTSKLHPRFKTH